VGLSSVSLCTWALLRQATQRSGNKSCDVLLAPSYSTQGEGSKAPFWDSLRRLGAADGCSRPPPWPPTKQGTEGARTGSTSSDQEAEREPSDRPVF